MVTGANGAGKSHVARALGVRRPDLPVISYDALWLTRDWKKRPANEISETLKDAVGHDLWILEGGPSLLPTALPRADAVIWLDPPLWLRAQRLAIRPWRHLGRTRPELPEGNVDRLAQQYRFAWQSLRRHGRFADAIAAALARHPALPVWHCRRAGDVVRALTVLSPAPRRPSEPNAP